MIRVDLLIRILSLAVCVFIVGVMMAVAQQRVAYLPEDSIAIEQLLREGRMVDDDTSLPLFFAKKFVGKPYASATLEVNAEEQLVVNTRQLDCTTFVETITALTLSALRGDSTFAAFCSHLRALRYRGGVVDGYLSRLHYFSEWIMQNEGRGVVSEIDAPEDVFSGIQRLRVGYMSEHPQYYKALSGSPLLVDELREYERRISGETVRYIPKQTALSSAKLRRAVKDGDILLVVTSIGGLDITHMGFAQWQSDGLHLLHASSTGKQVIVDRRTIGAYLTPQKRSLGLRVIRICSRWD